MACRRITRRSPARSGSNWCTSRSLDEIAQLNRVASMGELTASLSHELSQPQAAILSNAQAANRFLGGECLDLEQARECLTDFVSDDKRRRGDPALRGLLRKGEQELGNFLHLVSMRAHHLFRAPMTH